MKRSNFDPLASVLVDRLSTPQDLDGVMERLGYGHVTEWIRPGPPDVYARQLLMGLERRGLLDQELVQGLAGALPEADSELWDAAEELGIRRPVARQARQERVSTEAGATTAADSQPSFLGRLFNLVRPGSSVEEQIRYQDSLTPAALDGLLRAGRSVARVRIGIGGAPPQPMTTGFLVAPRLLLVPDYVMVEPAAAQTGGVPKHLGTEDLQVDAVADFGFGRSAEETSTIPCSGVAAVDWQAGIALLRLETAAPARPLLLSTDTPSAGERLHLIHHPHGGSQRYAVHQCVLQKADDAQVEVVAPTLPGSAGAPLLDDDLRVVGTVYVRDAQGVRIGPSSRAVLDALRNGGSALWDEVRGAQSHLKTIDPRLESVLAEAAQSGRPAPLLIRLTDEDADLTEVPDLEVASRTGPLVTATGSSRSLGALRTHPQVVAVEASLDDGAPESAEALDIIGVPVVHAPRPDGFDERGDHALVAVIDNGADVLHPAFVDAAGATRIVAFWDQLHPGDGGRAAAHSEAGRQKVEEYGLRYGKLYTAADIEAVLRAGALPADFPRPDHMAHGTLVTSIAAGTRCGDPPAFQGGVAPEAGLLIVRYDRDSNSIGYSKGHADALAWIGRVADELDLPVVVNISNGMNAGAHDGSSEVEKHCDLFSSKSGRAIVKSAGNEGQQGRHARITVPQGSQRNVRWRTVDEPGRDILELWFPSGNDYEFTLVPPGIEARPLVDKRAPSFTELIAPGLSVEMKLQEYVIDNGDGRLSLEITPADGQRVRSGEWRLRIRGLQVKKNQPVDGWIEISGRATRFLADTSDDVTLTIPGTARSVLCVSAATKERDFIEVYEGASRGPTRQGAEKPDLVAPGVGIRAARAGRPHDLSQAASGTSFAAPQVAGAIALKLSQWRKKYPDPAARTPLNFGQLRSAILDHSHPGDGNWDKARGWGRLDVKKFFAVEFP